MIIIKTKPYNRIDAVSYALFWALGRNPRYYDFSDLGGDCTNYVSQCLFAGCKTMNFTPVFGWYYKSSYDRAPAWTSVNFLYDFLTTNTGLGPQGELVTMDKVLPGDIIQIKTEDTFSHSLIITKISSGKIYVCAHSQDARMRPLNTYTYNDARFIHISGIITEE